jgi:hypothetical protein
VWEHGEYRFACGALETPDGNPAQPDTRIVRVTRQTLIPLTGDLVLQLKTEREEKGEDELDKPFFVLPKSAK